MKRNLLPLVLLILSSTLIVPAQTPVAPPPRPGQSSASTSVDAPVTMPEIKGQHKQQNGIDIIDIRVGTGVEIKPDDFISYHYTWWLASTGKRAIYAESLTQYNAQLNKLSPATMNGLTGMRVGGKRRVFVPAAMAWGANGFKSQTGEVIIPPNSDMVLDFEALGSTQFPTGPAITKVAGVSGPSLDDTLKFIGERLSTDATVNFIAFGQNTTDSSTWQNTFKYGEAPFHADIDACLISNTETISKDGAAATSVTSIYFFNTFEDVVVKPAEQFLTESNAKLGNPNQVITSTTPPTLVLMMRAKHGNYAFFYLTDASIADRIAKAMTHAIEICGGGHKDPF